VGDGLFFFVCVGGFVCVWGWWMCGGLCVLRWCVWICNVLIRVSKVYTYTHWKFFFCHILSHRHISNVHLIGNTCYLHTFLHTHKLTH